MGVSVSQLEKGQESVFWSTFKGEVALSSRAAILRSVSHRALWENFLMSTASSFAVTLSDLATLLDQSVIPKENSRGEQAGIKEYVDLIRDMNDQGETVAVDFMGIF